MPSFLTAFTALAVAMQINSTLAAPTVDADLTLSIRVADIVKNDLSTAKDHPLIGLYTRWLHTSPYAEFIRHDPTTIPERFPTLTSIDCYEDKDTCMLTSRMAMSEETAEMARQEALKSRAVPFGLFWDTDRLVTEIHYKTYHWLGEGEDREYAGFEQYVTWDWNCRSIFYRSSGGSAMADHNMEVIHNAPGTAWVATLTTTITHDGPLHNEKLVATFSCGIFSNKCCLQGGYEDLYIDGKQSAWAAKPERTCHWGRQSKDKCD